MKTDHLNTIINGIRDEAVSPAVIEDAANRVRARLLEGEAGSPATHDWLRTCADFQKLMPQYLNGTLARERSMLLVDHSHSCVACRHALDASQGKVRMLRRPTPISNRVSPVTRWAVAAMVAIGVGAGTFSVVRSLMAPPGVRATVQDVSGSLYQIAGATTQPLFQGRELGERQVVRTAKGSTAQLKLFDGSTVEMNQRSELYISRAARGTTIYLDRGNVIVHAAKQKSGALYVKTADCEVMVKGTIFAVTSGTKGSRVTVAEGSVKVDHGSQSQMLKPGQQANTDPSVAEAPVRDEFAWSREAAQYLAVLGELSNIRKQLEQMPSPALRTSSNLIDLVPANTVVYAAIPNIGDTLAEANRLFQERIQSSPILREWWDQQGKNGQELQGMIDRLRTASSYLGNEVVLAIPSDSQSRMGAPMLFAEAKRAGLQEFMHAEFPQFSGNLYVANGVVAMAPHASAIQDLETRIQRGPEGRRFRDTPFYDRIQQAYRSGAGWLFAADLQRIVRQSGDVEHARRALKQTGMGGVQYLMVERKDVNGQARNQATLGFNGDRQGIASWLAAPGPMSTLEFISPDASVVGSFVLKNPGALLAEFITNAEAANPEVQQHVTEFENRSGVSLVHDIGDTLGGELTFAIDGPLLPTPSWKLAVEVYSPDRLEWAIERLVAAANQEPGLPAQVQLTKTQANGRTYYTVTTNVSKGGFSPELDYVYVDGYLLAASSRTLLDQAIQNRSTGYTLPRSEKFRALLPKDANPNFSAIVYHNVGEAIGAIVNNVNSVRRLDPAQQTAINALKSNSAPGLIYAYGEPDRITIAANGGLFGFNLESLALPKMFGNVMRGMRPR